jgi:hypothetical protein
VRPANRPGFGGLAFVLTIWKYSLQFEELQEVTLPKGSKILTVVNQRDVACLYALVDPNESKFENHKVWCHGTGHKVEPEGKRYLATAIFLGGGLVLHYFCEE